jgi:hypothetical protein
MATPDEIEALLSKPDTKAGRLQRALLALLLEHEGDGELPTSNRFGLYELRQSGSDALYGHYSRKDGRSQDQNLSDASKHLRDVGIVPWSWVTDERRFVTAYR